MKICANKENLTKTLTQGLDIKEAAQVTGLGHTELKRLQDDLNSPTVTKEEAAGSGTVESVMRKAYLKFFNDNTEALSGAKRDTRTLAIPKHVLLARLFGKFPSMLRGVMDANPAFVDQV